MADEGTVEVYNICNTGVHNLTETSEAQYSGTLLTKPNWEV
jgi:hypothetical protein